jgi:hypothetical protein
MSGNEAASLAFIVCILAAAAMVVGTLALVRANHPSEHLGKMPPVKYECKLVKR